MIEGQSAVSGDWPPALVWCLPIIVREEELLGLLLTLAESGTFKRLGSFKEARSDDFDITII